MMGRHMGCGCRGLECGLLSRASCQPLFKVLYAFRWQRSGHIVLGDRSDDRVQDVAWPNSVVRREFSVAFEQEEID